MRSISLFLAALGALPSCSGVEPPPARPLPPLGAFPDYALEYELPSTGERGFLSGADPHRDVSPSTPLGRPGDARATLTRIAEKVPLGIATTVEAFDGHPVIRQRLIVENRGREPIRIKRVSLLNQRAPFPKGGYEAFYGLERTPRPEHPVWFRPHVLRVGPDQAFGFQSGRAKAATWLALAPSGPEAPPTGVGAESHRDSVGSSVPGGPSQTGLFFGWETNLTAQVRFGDLAADGACQVEVTIAPDILLDPGERFEAPEAFVGAFTGDLDEAAYRTHRFVEAHLARPVDDARFPYVMFNSWGFGPGVDDGIARGGIPLCAKLGVEVFVVDFGWEDPDWAPRADRFPNGLAPLADLAHAHGMKFGSHFAFGNLSSLSKAYREHPEWAFGDGGWCYKDTGKPLALSLGHPGAQAWVLDLIEEVVARDKLDWFLTDSRLWGNCNPEVQTLRASNEYASVALGFERILDEVNRRLPGVLVEHCDGGATLLTYRMVRNHVTSIVCDNAPVLDTRISVYYNTYPFPPRYQDTYMQEWGTAYCHRSHMFGGPWILMNKINSVEPGSAKWERLAKDIAKYKELRGLIRDGKVLHLVAPWSFDPAKPWDGWDAIGSYHPGRDRAVVFVFRTRGDVPERVIPLKALRPEGRYRVRFEDAPVEFVKTGAELMRDGVKLSLEAYEAHGGKDVHASEIVYIDPIP